MLKAAIEGSRLVKLQIGNHLPSQLVAAKVIGKRLLLQRRGQDRRRRQRPARCIQTERGRGRRSQGNLGAGLVLVGSNQAIEKTQHKQAAFDRKEHAPPAGQDRPQLAQGRRRAVAAGHRRRARIRLVRLSGEILQSVGTSVPKTNAYAQISWGNGRSRNSEGTIFPANAALYAVITTSTYLGRCLRYKSPRAALSQRAKREKNCGGNPRQCRS